MDKEKLQAVNYAIAQLPVHGGDVAFSRGLFPGIFRGDQILFVAQNPGQPPADSRLDVQLHKHGPVSTKEEYRRLLKMQYVSYSGSKFWKFLMRFVDHPLGLSENDISFTNLVKYATINNQAPEYDAMDCIMLTDQIEALEPARVISFGKMVNHALNGMGVKHEAWYHPAYFRYAKTERFQ